MEYDKVYLMLQVLHLSLNVPGTDNIRAKAMMDLMNLNTELGPKPVEAALMVDEETDTKEERRV